MMKKNNIFLIGPVGSGKSTIGKHLSKKLNMEFYDSDKEIEKRTGVDIGWIFDLEGEEGFRKRENKIILELTDKQGIILAAGVEVIKNKNNKNRLSARGIVIYLKTSIEKQLSRTKHDKKKLFWKKQNTILYHKLKKLEKKNNLIYKDIADFTILTDKYNTKKITHQIIKILENK
ncbi:shikimate kinase AroK [Candidatus Purcelliella pentastirinorum]|uniref:Shikimate kinase 1 n=1 Tax=Candidatus Purcelliella pentastirinorum TaxID=472834 RepID=A0AAX3N7Z0_9ENTR|nr:shikimate kinase AroK [Candidatus Purcelliella pentastirinorum]WDI78747.1 shikimate kinase AroK [Candidatus Purcelliella pentastirinorum]WDR80734.1 shikimate kinase AroK [Candidatus Purcelliella pentastirinorum]